MNFFPKPDKSNMLSRSVSSAIDLYQIDLSISQGNSELLLDLPDSEPNRKLIRPDGAVILFTETLSRFFNLRLREALNV